MGLGTMQKQQPSSRLPEGHGGNNGIAHHTPTPDMYETSSTPLPQGTRAFHGVSWRNGASSSASTTPQPHQYPPGSTMIY